MNIFESAKRVVIWLGDSNAENDIECQEFTIYSRIRPVPLTSTQATDPTFRAPGAELLASIKHLFCRPWFTGAWVQQVSAACPGTIAICGQYMVSFDEIFVVAWLLEGYTNSSSWTPKQGVE